MDQTNPFHCCATCIHFRVEKERDKVGYRCSRLTYETRPDYRFQCWTPKEGVLRLMEKREKKDH
ncbi:MULTISPECIES: hypothetical protein [Brevibacillus]|uniref:Uncharacterized protein n=1 Tax=Brevibacillus invocatus TaxID=173959 RepID=A0A3M8CMM3_9BACL|nr:MULTISPECIES: hypothetical protein [Brevibacillus]MCM3079227.1 hypothetical protein [Brevibacillus invocatus]MCM3429230.1 hypothetical protein [Brevibacillus invocatus]MDH4615610.1 hypothetical protein [Brevibacillus sp. AY1]RNB76883.1 hypothetical protein EDM52_01425 [Brevibacillus invocatus]